MNRLPREKFTCLEVAHVKTWQVVQTMSLYGQLSTITWGCSLALCSLLVQVQIEGPAGAPQIPSGRFFLLFSMNVACLCFLLRQ